MLCTKLTQHCKSTIYTLIKKKNRKTKNKGALPCRSVETRRTQSSDPASHLPTQTGKLLHKLLHTPPPNSLSSILNCARFQILTPAQTSKYTCSPTTSLFPRSSPGQPQHRLIWTKAVLAVLVPAPAPSSQQSVLPEATTGGRR